MRAGDLGFGQSHDRVVLPEEIARLGPGLDDLLNQRPSEHLRCCCGELGLANARLSPHQKRTAGRQRSPESERGPFFELMILLREAGTALSFSATFRTQTKSSEGPAKTA
jgi:hypothetical protein